MANTTGTTDVVQNSKAGAAQVSNGVITVGSLPTGERETYLPKDAQIIFGSGVYLGIEAQYTARFEPLA